jgi:hypothetical protein
MAVIGCLQDKRVLRKSSPNSAAKTRSSSAIGCNRIPRLTSANELTIPC